MNETAGTPPSRAERFATLDGMRGVAALALALALYHWGLGTEGWAEPGYFAVDFIFALSGFVITFNYAQRLADGMPPGQFMTKRVICFFPTYLVGHLLGIVKNIALQIVSNPGARTGAKLVLAIGLGFFMLPVPLDVRNLFPLNAPA